MSLPVRFRVPGRPPAPSTSGPARRSLPAPGRLAALAALALGAWLAAAPLLGQEADVPPELKEQRAQIRQLSRERSQAQQQLARLGASETELRLEIEQLAELVRTSLRRKEALEQRIARQQELLAEQGRQQARLEEAIRAGRHRIVRRLRRLYRVAKQDLSTVLFQMARYRSFARDSRYLALLQDGDRAAIVQFEALTRELAEHKRLTEQGVQRLLGLRSELDEETRQLSEREAYLRTAMGDLIKNRELYRRYVQDVGRMMAGMEATVARLEREARTAAPPPRPLNPLELRGSLPPPAQGEVIAAFGAQDPRYDLKKRQRGILLRVGPHAPVAAVAAGRAVHAGPFRGYQQLVVLDHGQGLFTVYGYLEDVGIKRGDWVAQGALLGRAAYQPVEAVYDVYFEIRHNGRPDDPLAWLQPGALRLAPLAAPADGAAAGG